MRLGEPGKLEVESRVRGDDGGNWRRRIKGKGRLDGEVAA